VQRFSDTRRKAFYSTDRSITLSGDELTDKRTEVGEAVADDPRPPDRTVEYGRIVALIEAQRNPEGPP
jgi:hypothetical protein